jgi:hypothetical protein
MFRDSMMIVFVKLCTVRERKTPKSSAKITQVPIQTSHPVVSPLPPTSQAKYSNPCVLLPSGPGRNWINSPAGTTATSAPITAATCSSRPNVEVIFVLIICPANPQVLRLSAPVIP